MTLVQAGSTMAASTRCFRRCLPHLLLLLHLLICCGSPVHGHSAQPPPPPRLLTQSLSGSSWQLTSSNGSIHAPATVPGSAYLDLLHSHVIPEPYYRFNEQSTRWVALTDWHYSTTFIPLPSLLSLPHVELVFDGIDTIATVLLDDRPILRTNDMFRRWVVDVTEQLRGGGQHRLEVRLQSAVAYAAQLNASYPYPLPRADAPAQHPLGERQFVRKSQVDWGWNNQPAFGTVGIYRDVHLVAFRNAIIRDVVASQTHANALTHADAIAQGLRAGDVQLNVTAYLRVAPRSPSSVFFHACVAGLCVNSSSVDLTAPLDQSGDALVPISAILVVPSPALWWPQTLGNATLHPFHLTLFSSPTQAEHSLTRRIGFRYLSIRRSPTPPTPGLTFQVEVNGVAMFVRGTNVVPLDSFHARVTPEWRERLVESLRPDDWYDRLDEAGIIAWQEFPFACAMYPTWPWWLDGVREETAQIVRRLSTHASVLLWGGNNENEEALTWFPETTANRDRYLLDYDRLYTRTVRDALRREIGDSVEFLVSSPSNGPLSLQPFTQRWGDTNDPSYGDVHFYLYDSDLSDPTVFMDARFVSEHGFPSHSSYHATAAMSLPADRYPTSPLMLFRNRLSPTAGFPDGLVVLEAQLERHFLPPNASDPKSRFHHHLYLTQCVQAMHYQGFLERYRRAQSGGEESQLRTQGVLFWMANEGWPGGPSKATIEWDGRWKVAQYAVRRAFADVIVSGYSIPHQDRVRVYVVNDLLHAWTGTVDIRVRRWADGGIVGTVNVHVTAKPQAATLVLQASVTELLKFGGCSSNVTCFVSLHAAPTASPMVTVGNGWIFLAPLKLVALPYPNVTLEVLGPAQQPESSSSAAAASSSTLAVRLSCTAPAPYVFLETPLSGVWSDNGFVLLPDSPLTLTFTSWGGQINAQQLTANLTLLTTQTTIAASAASGRLHE